MVQKLIWLLTCPYVSCSCDNIANVLEDLPFRFTVMEELVLAVKEGDVVYSN